MAGVGVVTPENEQRKEPPRRPLVVGLGWLGWLQKPPRGAKDPMLGGLRGGGEEGERRHCGAGADSCFLLGGARVQEEEGVDGDCVVEVEASCSVSCLVGAFRSEERRVGKECSW